MYAPCRATKNDMELVAALPEPVRAVLALFAILLLIVPLCMAFGRLLGALFTRRRRNRHALAFAGTLAATAGAPFLLLAATQQGDGFLPLLLAGLALPSTANWWLSAWAVRR